MIPDPMSKLPVRVLIGVALVAILGSLLYYTLPVTRLGIAVVVALSTVIAGILPLPGSSSAIHHPPSTRAAYGLAAVIVLALAAWWSAISPVHIVDAVRSPWGAVPVFVVAAIGIALFALLVLLTRPPHRLSTVLTAALLFSAVAMAAVVYPLGAGFDPYLHRATMTHIAEFGTITPKPLYYIGQYALELAPHLLLGLPLGLIDRLLLPVLAATVLTDSMLAGLAPFAKHKSAFALSALVLLPLGSFIATTPQGIAYVLCASAILFTFVRMHDARASLAVPGLLALAALLTHPFAGIPALLYVAAFYVVTKISRPEHKSIAVVLAAIAGVFAIPAMFAVQAARSGLSLSLNFGNLFDASRWSELALTGFFSNHYSLAYDALYLALDNLLWIMAAVAVAGAVALWRRGTERHLVILPVVFTVAMVANFLTLSILFDFQFLISYERSDYALRSLMMAQLFLLPLAGIGLSSIEQTLRKKPLALRTSFLVLLAVIGMGNVYGAYPRHDNYARSAGFNVSRADFDAVDAIDDKAQGENYIVLSNQATAAAAVESAGFKKYYHGDIFYYPIPTGGVMYEHFLSMVNDGPTRETMDAAMDVAGVNLGFFAVSDYWWKSEEIRENAKRVADDWFSVDGGKVTVFIFRQ